jgi:hypothetical protein
VAVKVAVAGRDKSQRRQNKLAGPDAEEHMEDLEARTARKVSERLIPFLMICYFIAYLDRVNVGFAALTMNKSFGLTAIMFGFGSGVFSRISCSRCRPIWRSTASGRANGSRASC